MHNVLAHGSTVHALAETKRRTVRGRTTKQKRHTLSERILLTRKLIRQQLNGLISHAATLTLNGSIIRPRTIRARISRILRLSIRRSHITGSSSSTHAATHARNSRSSSQKRETSTRTLVLRNTQGTLLYCRKYVTKQISRQRHHHNIAELKNKRASRKDRTAARQTHAPPVRSHQPTHRLARHYGNRTVTHAHHTTNTQQEKQIGGEASTRPPRRQSVHAHKRATHSLIIVIHRWYHIVVRYSLVYSRLYGLVTKASSKPHATSG